MTEQQVIQWLRQLRYDRRPSIQGVADAAGVSRRSLYNAINSGCLSVAIREAVAKVSQREQIRAYQNRRSRVTAADRL
jgi:cytosine/adenosine deaminase-related metal-dependent hydrolase